MTHSNRVTGEQGESLAADYLVSKGYVVLEKNYRFDRAEVDLICFQPASDNRGGEIVFVEVKARRSTAFGEPEDAVTARKQRNIIKAASAYLYETKMEKAACRFDVVAISLSQTAPEIRHFPHAFDTSDTSDT